MTDQAKKKTNAERQRAYRERHRANSGQRLDMQISLESASTLNLLSKVHKKSKKDIVEELLAKEMHRLANDPDFNVNDYI